MTELNRCVTGDCREVLRQMIAEGVRVQMCVTSPPYWGLRDYNVDGQLGLEPTIDEYVANMVEVFRLVRQLLADDGTIWLNLGDSYTGGNNTGGIASIQGTDKRIGAMNDHKRTIPPGLKPKDLCGIPWRVAFALQADGWYLRSDIIWHKPNPMPESCTDRPTKAHEYLFLLTKRANYYYDSEAVKEPQNVAKTIAELDRQKRIRAKGAFNTPKEVMALDKWRGGESYDPAVGRNRRTVWTIPSEPCILAGSSERGHCPCGARSVRVVGKGAIVRDAGGGTPKLVSPVKRDGSLSAWSRPGGKVETVAPNAHRQRVDLGFRPTCSCKLDPVPDVVLDPFLGSGTVAQVAQNLGRNWLGIDLNPEYSPMQQRRTAQQAMTL